MGTSGQPAVARIHARIGPSAVRLTLSPPTRLLFPCAHMMVLSRSCRHRVFIWVDISLLSRFHSGLRLSKHTEISHTEPSWGCGWGRMARAGRETRQIIAPPRLSQTDLEEDAWGGPQIIQATIDIGRFTIANNSGGKLLRVPIRSV